MDDYEPLWDYKILERFFVNCVSLHVWVNNTIKIISK